MPKPKVLGVAYAPLAAAVRASWENPSARVSAADLREAAALLKSLRTFEFRARSNPLAAGDPVARDRWPGDLARDYGHDIPNLFRFELAFPAAQVAVVPGLTPPAPASSSHPDRAVSPAPPG